MMSSPYRQPFLGMVLAFLCFSALASDELSEHWQSATQKYEAEDYSGAALHLERWVSIAESQGMRSAEAHKNLALAYWKLSNPAPTTFHILKEMSLRKSPARILAGISSLQQIQKEIGATDNIATTFVFYFHFLMNPTVQLWFATVAFWALVLLMLTYYRPSRFEWMGLLPLRIMLGAAIFLSLLLSGGGASSRVGSSRYAVITGVEEVWLFEDPKGAKRLVEIPSGTIVVSTGMEETPFVEISSPMSAWVSVDSLLRLDS